MCSAIQRVLGKGKGGIGIYEKAAAGIRKYYSLILEINRLVRWEMKFLTERVEGALTFTNRAGAPQVCGW
jgi:hypothetical protein